MHKGLFFLVILSFAVQFGHQRKQINIGIFLNDDDQYELSTIAVSSIVRRINLFTKTEYLLRPHIFRASKGDLLETGKFICQLIEKGIAAIFGPESPEINEMIQSVSSGVEIPQFQTFWNPKLASANQSFQGIFNLHPSPSSLSKALATLVRENDWKSYTVLYENEEAVLRLQGALKRRSPTDPAVEFRNLGPRENHRTVLKEVKSSGVLHLILDCETAHIMDILREARELKLLSEFHSYILTNLDAHTLDWSELKQVRTNITAIRLLNTDNMNTRHAVLVWNQMLKYDLFGPVHNLALQKELDLFRKKQPSIEIQTTDVHIKSALLYDALNLFISVYSELDAKEKLTSNSLSCESNDISLHGRQFANSLKERNQDSPLLLEPLTGDIWKFDEQGYRTNYKLQIIELYATKFRMTATWQSQTPDSITLALTERDRDTELKEKIQHRTFRVVSRLGDPYLMLAVPPDGNFFHGNDRYEGYSMDIMKEICKPVNLNCSFTFDLVPDGMHGNYDTKTKQWNGLIKELLEYKADLGVCDLTITYERRKAVDFTMPFMTLGISILYAKAVKEPPELLSFSHPLSFEVWIYIATSYLIISITMFLVARMNPNDWENPHPCNPNPQELENIWNIRNCCWLTLGSFMAQGCDLLPKRNPVRLSGREINKRIQEYLTKLPVSDKTHTKYRETEDKLLSQ